MMRTQKGTLMAILAGGFVSCNRLRVVLKDTSLFISPAICLEDRDRSLFTRVRIPLSIVSDVFYWIFLDQHHFFVVQERCAENARTDLNNQRCNETYEQCLLRPVPYKKSYRNLEEIKFLNTKQDAISYAKQRRALRI